MRQERPVPTIKQTRPPSLQYPSQMKPSEGIVNKPSRPVNVESGPGRPSHQTQNPSAQAQRRPPAVAQNDVSVLFLGDRMRSKLWFNWWRPHYCEIFYRDWSPLTMIDWRQQRSGFMKDTNKPKMVNFYVHLMFNLSVLVGRHLFFILQFGGLTLLLGFWCLICCAAKKQRTVQMLGENEIPKPKVAPQNRFHNHPKPKNGIRSWAARH